MLDAFAPVSPFRPLSVRARARAGRPRGSAVTEFIICLFPYMIILLGAIFFWHLALGKQELFDYSQAAAAAGDQAGGGKFWNIDGARRLNAPRHYAPGDEASYNAKVGIDAKVDEPVLPYAASGEDFKACVSRGVYVITANTDGTINVGLSKQGRRYQQKGLIKNVTTGDHLSPGSSLDFDVDGEIASAVSRALSEWVSYSGVDGGAYRFTLQFGASDNIALERGAVTENWRSQSGVTVGGRTLSAFTARIDDPGLRGDCHNVQISSLDTTLGTDVAAVSGGAASAVPAAWYAKYAPQQGGN